MSRRPRAERRTRCRTSQASPVLQGQRRRTERLNRAIDRVVAGGPAPTLDDPDLQGLLHLARTVSARPGAVPAKAADRLRAAVRRGRGGGAGAPGGGQPIWLHVPGRPAVDLPAEIPGMTALGAWPEVLARIHAEQGQRPGLEVAVYPCAPLQVLQPAGSPATLAPAT